MKKSRIISFILIAILLLSFAGCEIKDGMLWYDFQADDALFGVETDGKDNHVGDKDEDEKPKPEDVENPVPDNSDEADSYGVEC